MKRGNLNQMVFSLFLFLRDVGYNDFYNFIRREFQEKDQKKVGDQDKAFLAQFGQVYHVGPKLIDMGFSHLFFTRIPGWDYQEIGAEMVANDTLVDNFLARTGTLDEYKRPHKYGLACHTQKGFVGVIEEIAQEIDCRKYNPNYPAYFLRLVQLYIRAYCSMNGENICNGNKCKEGRPNRDCELYTGNWCMPVNLA